MPCLRLVGVSLLLGMTLSIETKVPGAQERWACRQGQPETCMASSMNLLQHRQSRSRLDIDSTTGAGNIATASTGWKAVPFKVPFYLKSAEHPDQYILSEGGHVGVDTHLTLSEKPDGLHGIEFVAEDVGSGHFTLRSKKHPKMYVGAESDVATPRLVWRSLEGCVKFAVERADLMSSLVFYLKSAYYADAFVQAEKADDQLPPNASLVFGPFENNASIKFIADTAVREKLHEDVEEVNKTTEYCSSPLVGGKKDKVIPDSAITVSSENPRDGNLNTDPKSETPGDAEDNPHGWGGKDSRLNDANSAWLPEEDNTDQWIQWDFGSVKRVRKIQTLGRSQRGKAGDEQWVSEYKISYTKDNESWTFSDKAVAGNYDIETLVEHEFEPPLVLQRIRLHPTQWNSRIALRAEFLGCDMESHEKTPEVKERHGKKAEIKESHEKKPEVKESHGKKSEVKESHEKKPEVKQPPASVQGTKWVPAEPGQVVGSTSDPPEEDDKTAVTTVADDDGADTVDEGNGKTATAEPGQVIRSTEEDDDKTAVATVADNDGADAVDEGNGKTATEEPGQVIRSTEEDDDNTAVTTVADNDGADAVDEGKKPSKKLKPSKKKHTA